MFRSALIKLTLLYLLIIMIISFFFSLNLYRISSSEIDYNLNRQQMRFEQVGRLLPAGPNDLSMINAQAEQLAEGQQRILWQLIYTNIFIFIAGGALSYLLAKITLRPIEESHEAQTRFTADASHELRSPLAAMKSEIEVNLRDPKLTGDEAIQILRSNLEEVDRLKTLSDGLLELSNGKDEFVFDKVSINEAIQTAISNMSKVVKTRKADIKVDVPNDLFVLVNRDSIVEVFTILLDNAIKYTKDQPTIAIKAGRNGKHIEIDVTDNGIGISKDDLPHVFERFYRSEPSRSKNEVEGYGLGLSIAEKIVHKNKGKIEVTSHIGEGTTFKVFLS
jgi:signal transduction histidine kinase